MPTPLNTANLSGEVSTLRIKPLGTSEINRPGAFIYVLRTPTRIHIKWDSGMYFPYAQGSSIDTRPSGYGFNRLEVFNPTTQEIEVEIYTGWADYDESSLTALPPLSRLKAADTTKIPAMGRVSFSGASTGGDIQRAAFIISNNDTTLNLEIHDPNNKPVLRVKPGDSITLSISEGLSVYNPNGADVSAYMGEILYTLQAKTA
jgi:hypothetical protein